MDREKLNKAALANTKEAADLIADPQHLAVNSFIQGALWLMQQPLSERLTDEEKEKIKERYDYYMSEEPNCYLGSRMRNEYEQIFGADLFREK